MKKFLSILVALSMICTTFAMLMTTATATSAATPDNKIVYSQDFDDLTVSAAETQILNAINWRVISTASAATTTTSIVEEDGNKVLNLTTAGGLRSFTVVEDEALKNGFAITYDFKYDSTNETSDQLAQFMGHNGASNAPGTWHVQPRLNGNLLNGYRTNSGGWGDTTRPSFLPALGETSALGTWFTLRIEGSYDGGVTVSMKKQGTSEWAYVDEYTVEEKRASKQLNHFVSGIIAFQLGTTVNVYLDNITIETLNGFATSSAPLMSWDFDGYTDGTSEKSASGSVFGWTTKHEGVTTNATVKFGAGAFADTLHLTANKTGDSTCKIAYKIIEDERLLNGFVLSYDFYYPDHSGDGTGLNAGNSGEAAEFLGYSEGSDTSTWHVQPRLNGKLLNSFKNNYNEWKLSDRATSSVLYSDPNWNSSGGTTNQWYSVLIEMDPMEGVTVKTKQRNASAWESTCVYTPAMIADMNNSDHYNSGSIYLKIRSMVDVYIDNIQISLSNTPYHSAPYFYGYQVATTKSGSATSSSNVTVTTTQNAIRLLGVIDQNVFDVANNLGFKVTIVKADGTSATFSQDCYYVYNHIDVGGTSTAAWSLCGDGKYLYALQIVDLPSETITIRVTPYYVEKETGNTVMGVAKTFEFTSSNTTTGTTNPST